MLEVALARDVVDGFQGVGKPIATTASSLRGQSIAFRSCRLGVGGTNAPGHLAQALESASMTPIVWRIALLTFIMALSTKALALILERIASGSGTGDSEILPATRRYI